MRILQVSRSDRGGGAENVAANLHRAFVEAGHDAWLAVGQSPSRDPRVLSIPNAAPRNALHDLDRRVRPLIGQVRGAGQLSLWLDRFARGAVIDRYRGYEDFHYPGTRRLLELPPSRPDVLHLHNLHGGYFDLRALPSLSHRVPTLVLMHDAWLLSGHCAHSFECDRWLIGCGACPDLSIPPKVLRDATASNWRRKQELYRASRLTVVTPSRWLMQRVERSMLADAMIAQHVIPYGIDLERFVPGDRRAARARLGLPLDADILLIAGSDIKRNPWKDYATLRAAATRLAALRPSRATLVLGLGERAPTEREGSLELRFVPFTNAPDQVAAYYAAADLYVHAARADTFPNVVLEALASGRAVVGTAIGGIPEQIRDVDQHAEPTGALVPPGDVDALAHTLARLLDSPALIRRMESNAAADARERFDLRDQVPRYLEVYDAMLGHALTTDQSRGTR